MFVDEAVDGALAIPAARHKPAIAEQSQLVAHAGLADADHLGQIAHAELTGGKRLEDAKAGRVAQCRERIGGSADHRLGRERQARAGDSV